MTGANQPNALLAALTLDNSGVGPRRAKMRLVILWLAALIILFSTVSGTLVAPAMAYWQDTRDIAVSTSAGTTNAVQITCTDIYETNLGAVPGGVRIEWNKAPNVIGYRVWLTWANQTNAGTHYTWTPTTVKYAEFSQAQLAALPTNVVRQHIHAGAALALNYPDAPAPTIARLIPSFNATEAIGSGVAIQVEALYGGNWASPYQTIATLPNTAVLANAPEPMRTPTATKKTVEFNADVFRDYMNCIP